jgi:regulator of cell morphogenesis and NO signaling
MNITSDMKMADVLFYNYSLLPVIARFNMKLGFGEKTVGEVCRDCKVNPDFFLEITNSFIDDDYIPQKDLHLFPVSLLVDYLKKTHQYYLDEKIPEIESMISRLVRSAGKDRDKFELINNFFQEYKNELINHITREESKVQPYVIEIENAFYKGKIGKVLYNKIRSYSMRDYSNEHDNVEEKLFDLKNIIIKYLPPTESYSLCNSILIELFRLEKDLNAHANLEDKVLIPKVSGMEEKLLSLYKSN